MQKLRLGFRGPAGTNPFLTGRRYPKLVQTVTALWRQKANAAPSARWHLTESQVLVQGGPSRVRDLPGLTDVNGEPSRVKERIDR